MYPFCVILLLFPFIAAFRYLFAFGPTLCLMLAVGCSALILVFIFKKSSGRAEGALPYMAVGLILSAYSIIRIHGPFNGLVTVGGGDAGNHILFAHLWGTSAHNIYYGMTATQAFFFFMNGITSSTFQSVFILQTLAILVVVFGYVELSRVLGKKFFTEESGSVAAVVATLLFGLALLRLIALPIIGYMQADGFYSMLFAVITALCGVVVLSSLKEGLPRLLWICVLILLLRFSYVLNLGEVLIAAAICSLAMYFRSRTLPEKAFCVAVISASVPASIILLQKMLERVANRGGYIGYDVISVAVALAMLALAVLLALAFSKKEQRPVEEIIFSTLFALSSVVVICLYLFFGYPRLYYFHKYLLVPAVIFGVVSFSFLQLWTVDLIKRLFLRDVSLTRLAASLVVVVLCVVSSQSFRSGLKPLIKLEQDRAQGRLKRIRPLADPALLEFVRQDIEKGRKFGGVILSSWPMSNFTNSALRLELGMSPLGKSHKHNTYEDYLDGPELMPGRSYYWYDDRFESRHFSSQKRKDWPVSASYRKLASMEKKRCQEYVHTHNQKTRRLCGAQL